MSQTDRIRRLHSRIADTRTELGHSAQTPVGPTALQVASLETVLDHVTSDRAEALVADYGHRYPVASRQGIASDPSILALCERPLAGIPSVRQSLEHLLSGPVELDPWPTDVDAFLARYPHIRAMHETQFFAGALPPIGLAASHRTDLRNQLEAGRSPDALLEHLLFAPTLHALARGPRRDWEGGWPCWVLYEAAITHVQRRCAPTHLFPDHLGGLGGYRSFAMIGAYLAAWQGEESVWRMALTSEAPRHGLGDTLASLCAIADLQVWKVQGGPHLGPSFSDPVAWIKLLAASRRSGRLQSIKRRLRGVSAVSWQTLDDMPDLLEVASSMPWSQLPQWNEPEPDDQVRDLLDAAVRAMFVEDVLVTALYAAPADPPDGVLTLDVDTCLLSARTRGHQQYTEPAAWLLPPGWVGDLHRRGLRRWVLRGAQHAHRQQVLDALLALGAGAGPLPEEVVHDLPQPGRRPVHVPTPASDLQIRHRHPLVVSGAHLAKALAERFTADHFEVASTPFGPATDPLSVCRGLTAMASYEPLPADTAVRTADAWTGTGYPAAWRFRSRVDAMVWFDEQLAASRVALRQQKLLVLCWETAWVDEDGTPRLLGVEEIAEATRQAVYLATQMVGRVRVALCIDPSRRAGVSRHDHHVSQATLRLAAHHLADVPEILLFPATELVHDELRDHAWFDADGAQLTPSAEDVLYTRLLQVWASPGTRAWIRSAHEDTTPRDMPFTPLAAPSPWTWHDGPPELDVEVQSSPAHAAWRAQFDETICLGEFIRYDAQAVWIRELESVLAVGDRVPAEHRDHTLASLAEKTQDLGEPDILAPAFERVLRSWMDQLTWDPEAVTPHVRFGLRMHWLEDLPGLFESSDEGRRVAVGRALLGDKRLPRKGRVLRTPLEHCIVMLLGWDEPNSAGA